MTNRLAIGTVQFGLDYGINNKAGQVSKEAVAEILNYAVEQGIQVLDTAVGYGNAEAVIGEAIRNTSLNFQIVSKLPASVDNADETKHTVVSSLKRLQVGSLYGYLIHDYNKYEQFPDIWKGLIEAKKENKVGKIGFSLYYTHQLQTLLKNGLPLDLVQVPYNVFDQRFAPYFSTLKQLGVEVHIRSTFLQGLFFIDAGELSPHFNTVKEKIMRIQALAAQHQIPLSALLLNFTLANQYIDKVVIGVDSVEQLKFNVGALAMADKVKPLIEELHSFKEENEDIILPFNWK